MSSLALTEPSSCLEAGHCTAGPRLRTVLRHLTLSLLSANVVPGLLFYLCLVTMNVWAALVGALAWCYGAMTWRWATGRRMSRLLVLTMIGLTAKTALTFASGSTFVYFAQPAANNGLIAAAFLVSLATARPVVARLAADFYPMSDELALRPRVQQLFWRLTLMWAVVCLGKAVATMWLLQSQSVQTFVLVKSTTFLAATLIAVVVTVVASVRVAREEGLLTRQAGTRPASAGSDTTSTGFPAAVRRTSTT